MLWSDGMWNVCCCRSWCWEGMSTMSDFESEEMGWRYRVDALTTSATRHREREKQGNCVRGYCCALQCCEVPSTSRRWIMWTVRLICPNVCRVRLSTCRRVTWLLMLRAGVFGHHFSTTCKLLPYPPRSLNCIVCVCECLDIPCGFSTLLHTISGLEAFEPLVRT